ncbi:hypothetical protein [Edaphobacter modestus]|uniref:Uncharacterized protein n=1 Tax=Edaphobacter modestus TaxID=388466 RepID=A0A4Q7YXL1_9BACT|nr:hypothetical protein [Edaphobacter modestus]RZU41829.1 hypothetical protein BDD14_3366 [Edaphobacter modestus]
MTQTARSPIALRRAADALFSSAGARSVMLRIPAPAIPGDPAEQLGLATPQFQDIQLSPVVFRNAATQSAEGKALRRDLIVSASAVESLTGSAKFASADALFASAFGVLVDDALLTITAATELEAGGAVYAYRLALREAIQNAP